MIYQYLVAHPLRERTWLIIFGLKPDGSAMPGPLNLAFVALHYASVVRTSTIVASHPGVNNPLHCSHTRYASPSHHNFPPSTPTYQFSLSTPSCQYDRQLHLREVIMPRHTCTSAIWGRGQAIRLRAQILAQGPGTRRPKPCRVILATIQAGEAAMKPGCRHSGSERYLQAIPARATSADVASK